MTLVNEFISFKNDIDNSKASFEEKFYVEPLEAEAEDLEGEIEDLNLSLEITLSINDYDLIKLFAGGASLCWQESFENDFIYGGMTFNDLRSCLIDDSDFWKVDFSLGPSNEVPEELKHFEQLNWFERQSWGDDERFGCFIREKGVFPPRIAFFDRNWYTELDLSLEEYFEALFASCAVRGWQYFYINWNQEVTHKETGLEDMELAVKLLPELFPDKDFSYHKAKLEEVKGLL